MESFVNPEYTPALFIGHGSPMNAISNNEYTKSLAKYAKSIKPPSAIIVVSAHWETHGSFITGSTHPEQIYDFFGFPDELYEVQYSPPGLPELAHQIESAGIEIKVDHKRGIDHAGWAVVKHMYPNQNIPLLEISLDVNKSFNEHFNLAKELIKYRRDNILFIGSGNIVHNLREITFEDNVAPFEWANEMDHWFKEQIDNDDIENILNYPKILPNHRRGMPTTEHFLPFLYTLGMKHPGENIRTIHESIQNGSISMRGIEIS
jgi:4,5-DOPA dioxygenase extradiol